MGALRRGNLWNIPALVIVLTWIITWLALQTEWIRDPQYMDWHSQTWWFWPVTITLLLIAIFLSIAIVDWNDID